MIEEDFIIRTNREGSIAADQKCEDIMSKMGCALMLSRNLGAVVVKAELENGTIVNDRIRWKEGNSPGFNKELEPNAKSLLEAVKASLLASGHGPGGLKIKIVAKK